MGSPKCDSKCGHQTQCPHCPPELCQRRFTPLFGAHPNLTVRSWRVSAKFTLSDVVVIAKVLTCHLHARQRHARLEPMDTFRGRSNNFKSQRTQTNPTWQYNTYTTTGALPAQACLISFLALNGRAAEEGGFGRAPGYSVG